MLGAGTNDPGLNPNAYPMTDNVTHPSAVRIVVNGLALGTFDLPDDAADHRGLLSWHVQKRDGKLDEAGSHGSLVTASVPPEALRAAAAAGELRIRLEVDVALPGGRAIYGEQAGGYPGEPTVVLALR
jgi:predicted transcriptional regulator